MLFRSNLIIRVAAFVGGITLIIPGIYTDMVGFGLLGGVLFMQMAKRKRMDAQAKVAE